MNVGIIDADLIGRKKHRFPNLVCEKLSLYWKEKGANVELILAEFDIDLFDKIYVSKVFTDTPIPSWLEKILTDKKVSFGGTGFYFDKAPNLPDDIEHHMPDYQLYDQWINSEIDKAKIEYGKQGKNIPQSFYSQFKEYQNYSIGFLTRGCFRKCKFCVNQKYNHVFRHSPLSEFFNPQKRKICLLDDNFLGCPEWKSMLEELIATGRPFKFKQGLDERLLTEEKCKLLFSAKYDGDFTFAFDNISDYDLIESKLKLIRKYCKRRTCIKFYVLVGFESTDAKDIENAFKRIALLIRYKCLPYLMRYMSEYDAPWKASQFRSLYISLARWCNQPNIIKKMTFREFCLANQALHKTKNTLCSSMKAMVDFEEQYPEIANKYFDLRFGEGFSLEE